MAVDEDGAVYEVGVADTGRRRLAAAKTGLARGAERVAAGVHRAAVARA